MRAFLVVLFSAAAVAWANPGAGAGAAAPIVAPAGEAAKAHVAAVLADIRAAKSAILAHGGEQGAPATGQTRVRPGGLRQQLRHRAVR